MTRWAAGLLAAVLLAGAAAAQDKPEDVVKKAIEAHGGADALKKLVAGSYAMKGKVVTGGREEPFTGTAYYQLPGKMRQDLAVEAGGGRVAVVIVANGEKASQSVNGQPEQLPDEVRKEIVQTALQQDLTQLTPLLEGDRFTLKAEKDADVGGRPAAVVLVTGKGLTDTRMYFDKKTGLLVKTSRKALGQDERPVQEEVLFGDYTKVSGVQVPKSLTVNHDGKLFLQAQLSEHKLSEKLDPKLFDVK